MSDKIKLRRGTDAQRQNVVFDDGEIIYTTDTKKIYIGDGSTLGGVETNSAPIIHTHSTDEITELESIFQKNDVLYWMG